jgi:hypothetical protein
MKFQGRLAGLTTPEAAVSVGGDRLVVADVNQLQIIETATHRVVGNPIAIPGGMINDIAPVPSAKQVAVAHSGGISIVNLDTGEVQTAAVGPVDRVTVGPAADKKMYAYGLIGRVAPPETPLVPCSGSSSIIAISVDAPVVTPAKPLAMGISGIAAAPSQPGVFATLPCAGQIARIEGDPTSEVAQLTLTNLDALQNAAAIAVSSDRLFAVGTRPSVPTCADGVCSSTDATACPDNLANPDRLSWVSDGARLVVSSMKITGENKVKLELPERRETMIDTADMASSHAQVLHPLGTVPLDLVVLPGGQYVSIVTRNQYFVESLYDQLSAIYVLPCMKTTSADWLLVDLASSSIAQRVRTSCQITAQRTANTYFDKWACDAAPAGEANTQGADYIATSVGALFGAR